MTWLIALWLALHSTDNQAEQLHGTSPDTLSVEQAGRHLQAAWGAALATHTDPFMLLYIAWHETRFQPGTRTREPGNKVSCGVMTPEPKKRCVAGTLQEQYLEGAGHLAGWYDYCQTRRQNPYKTIHLDNSLHDKCALTGYAGGTALISACRKGGRMWRQRGKQRIDLCATWQLYLEGADRFREAIDKDVR